LNNGGRIAEADMLLDDRTVKTSPLGKLRFASELIQVRPLVDSCKSVPGPTTWISPRGVEPINQALLFLGSARHRATGSASSKAGIEYKRSLTG